MGYATVARTLGGLFLVISSHHGSSFSTGGVLRPLLLREACWKQHYRPVFQNSLVNFATEKKNDEVELNDDSIGDGKFDGGGFANYLAPYLLAFAASVAVTVGFLKFVLMDY